MQDNRWKQALHESAQADIAQLTEFLRQRSISSDPRYAQQMQETCEWVRQILLQREWSVTTYPTKGHPFLLARRGDDPTKPTLLLYNHYDVQPAHRDDGWESDPFEPRIKEGVIYGRGAQDNKGQLLATLRGIDLHTTLPCNLLWLIDGEEEIGSPHLCEQLETLKPQLKADGVWIADSAIEGPTTPCMITGTRGCCKLLLKVEGAKHEAHSGMVGGVMPNAMEGMVRLISTLKDSEGRITIPNFYDGVKEERIEHLDTAFSYEAFTEHYGVPPVGGETAYTPVQRMWTRPALEVHNIQGKTWQEGFIGSVPIYASARISCRLVPGQDPATLLQHIKNYCENFPLPGLRVTVTCLPGAGHAYRTPLNHPASQAICNAYETLFEKKCRYQMIGATIPVMFDLAQAAGAPAVLWGMGLESDNIHGPNEHFSLERYQQLALLTAMSLNNFVQMRC